MNNLLDDVQLLMNIDDLLVAPIYIFLSIFLISIFARLNYKDNRLKFIFITGFLAKLFGCTMFALIYHFYYKGGDTFRFFRDAFLLFDSLGNNFIDIFQILFSKDLTESNLFIAKYLTDSDQPSTFLVVKIALLFLPFGLNTYYGTSVLFALFSFSGTWKLYRTAIDIFPKLLIPLSFPIFFFPSVFFWSSGLLKDSITFGCLGWLMYAFYMFFIKKKYFLKYIIIIAVTIYITFTIKAYITISTIPGLLVWYIFSFESNIKDPKLRRLYKPIAFLGTFIAVSITVLIFGSLFERMAIDAVISEIETTANYLYRQSVNQGGSAYSLGEVEYTPLGLIKAMPKAINVTLFRPYLWEASNPVFLLSALESSLIMLLSAVALLKIGFIKFIRLIFTNPFLLSSLFFALIFAFFVGIATYNFGSLVRYKIPCLPFYGIVLVCALYYDRIK